MEYIKLALLIIVGSIIGSIIMSLYLLYMIKFFTALTKYFTKNKKKKTDSNLVGISMICNQVFDNKKFTADELNSTLFVNCIFCDCDFYNIEFYNTTMFNSIVNICKIDNCKLDGLEITSSLINSEFNDCTGEFKSLTGCLSDDPNIYTFKTHLYLDKILTYNVKDDIVYSRLGNIKSVKYLKDLHKSINKIYNKIEKAKYMDSLNMLSKHIQSIRNCRENYNKRKNT